MKKFSFLAAFVVIGAALYLTMLKPGEPGFELEEGYQFIYDGKTLEGWRVIGGESTFEPRGESILGHHGPGANTFLRTERTFADFSLRMQMRWDELGNSGVLFRAQQRDGEGRAYGYQFELDHSERAWSGGIYDEARRGWLANLESNEEARQAIKLDDWNDVEIEARGGRLKTWINGVQAADIVDGFDDEGFIALQVHSGDVGIMRWRHIRIKEFERVAVAGEPLVAEDWTLEGIEEIVVDGGKLTGTLLEQQGWLSSRRRFNDARLRFSVPACDSPTIVRMRYDQGETSGGASYAEVSIFADRAEGRLVTSQGITEMEPVGLVTAKRHRFTGVTVGKGVTLSVGEEDVLRQFSSEIMDRGRLQISPANCTGTFELGDISWTSLRENREQVSFYKTLDTAPAPVLSPEEALEAFRIAPGFEIELVAAEPLVEDPVAMAWDEYGRLYVVEMRGYMPDAYGTGDEEPVGQVVRLEDIDGDGRMDKSEVFLGELVNPRAVAVVNDGILIGEPPNLWLCELLEKEALCSERRRIGGYADSKDAANVEHMENRLLPGLDNWMYNSKSARRMRVRNGELETAEGKYRGQWGISKDDMGRLFYNHNSSWLQADFFHADDMVIPGVETALHGVGVTLTDPSEVFTVRVNPGVNRAYLEGTLRPDGRLNTATGASGLVVYRGDQFPEAFRGHAFVPESAGNVVAQFALSDHGIAIEAEQQVYADEQWGQRDFLGSTDERFRPVDAANGPDGALYIIDMYRGIIQDDHFLTEELREQIFQRGLDKPVGKGRIWRIRHSEGRQDRTLTSLADAGTLELVSALKRDNGWVRDTAQRLLLSRTDDVSAALAETASADATVPALHAIWALHGRNELNTNLVLKLASAPDSQRQIQALRAGVQLLDAGQLVGLSAALQDADESVVMQYALALGTHANDVAARRVLGGLLDTAQDSPFVRQAVVRAVLGNELEFLAELLAGGRLVEETASASTALSAIAASAYRSIRGDLGSAETPDPALLELLSLVESQVGEQGWQQIAMLSGFESVLMDDGFVPATFAAPPTIFTDATVSEKDPLWDARLRARRAFTWPGDEMALGIKPLSPEQLALMELGRQYYPTCGNCHGKSGAGTAGLAPALAGASWVTGPPEWLGRIILQGISGPIEVNGEQWDGVMPPHGHLEALDDETLAGLMTYMRRSWGNKADPVSIEQVTEIRQASASRSSTWTVDELQQVPFDRGLDRYVGKYSVSFVTITISERKEGLYMKVPMYGEGPMSQVSENTFTGTNSGQDIKAVFELPEEGPATKFVLYTGSEKITFKRKKG
jgi:glucose/arabinose dehydrogenase/mono/diheme cytochrome c family protein